MKQGLLIIVIFVASVLRLWELGNVPLSPDWDEVSLGYNAYSILKSGRDEYGVFLPVVLRSFDDYKPALYAYFAIPFIKAFGLSTASVRIPSALMGIVAVLATYLLVKELSKSKALALLTSFLLAVSPWHIQFSRIAFESNVGVTLNLLTALLFLKGLKNPVYLLLSFLVACTNVYMYQGEKVFTPLLLLILIITFRSELRKIKKAWIVSSLFVSVLILIPMIQFIFTNQDALLRARGVSVFSDQTQFLKRVSERLLVDRDRGDYVGYVLDNRRIEYTKAVLSGYVSHFDLNWLFITGDIARHHAPRMGLLYIWELPFLLIGIYSLVFGKFDRKTKLVIFLWFLMTPIPASITTGVPHAVRTLNFLPTFQIFTAIGLITTFQFISISKYKVLSIKHYVSRVILYTPFLILASFNIAYYLNQYFVQQNFFHAKEWQYGYEKAVSKVKEVENRYERIVVTNSPHLDQSYIFFLFYLKYPPSLYQEEAREASGGFREEHRFGKFEFRPILWEKEEKANTLFVGRSEDFPEDAKVIKTVSFLDGTPAIKIVEG